LKRKLLLLNVALALLLIYAGRQLRQTYQAAKAREAATLARQVRPAPPPPFTPLPPAPPVVAGGYSEIVQQMLFDRSRNPTVPVELPPPPPPKPVPPLPVYHGMMNLGDGPTVVLAVDAKSPHQGIHPGESIGDFKLVSVNTQEITFEWDGKTIRKRIEELEDHGAEQQHQQQAAAAPAPASAGTAQPAAPVAQTPKGPGIDIGAGMKACQPNDSNPAGAIVEGFRKMVFPTPFGQTCRWDPVN